MDKTLTNKVFAILLPAAILLLGACSGGGGGLLIAPTQPPTITTQPASQSVVAPATATFTVVASGSALSYQWNRNGTAISGATAASYTTPATTTADNGASFTVTVTSGGGNVTSNAAILTVTATGVAPSITTQPANQTVSAGATATFTVVAAGTSLSYQWQRNNAPISGATAASYTTPATTQSDSGATFRVIVSNSVNTTGVTSTSATLTVTAQAAATADVTVYHNDNQRTGQNLRETILTPANVRSATFGKLNTLNTDGKVDAQPLYLSALTINGGTHNVLYVVTEHNSVYAFDADSGAVLWQQRASIVPNGEVPGDGMGCNQVLPEIGITSTPVIDRNAGTIYLVAMSRDTGGTYHQRLHALNLATGAEKTGSPVEIQASYPGTYSEGNPNNQGRLNFLPSKHKDRMAPVLVNGVVYTSWSSHCDANDYTGWVIGYNASTLAQTSVFAVTPNSGFIGGGLWSANGAPAVDAQNNLYLFTGNGLFDATLDANGFPNKQDYGNAFLKLSTTNNTLAVADYFAMFDTAQETAADNDLASGGAIVLPDLKDAGNVTRHLSVGAGKDRIIYVADRDNMGKFNTASSDNRNLYQEMRTALAGPAFSTPAYFNNTVYFGAVNDSIKAFAISNARLGTTPSSKTATTFGYPGVTPSISANGATNAILWAQQNGGTAVLRAFDATNLATELYNSNQAANGRDQFGAGNKFIVPTIANGKVFVGTNSGVAVFGLLP